MNIPWRKIGSGIKQGLAVAAPFHPYVAIAAGLIHAAQQAGKDSGPDKKAKVYAAFLAVIGDKALKLTDAQKGKLTTAFSEWNDVYVSVQNLVAQEEEARKALEDVIDEFDGD